MNIRGFLHRPLRRGVPGAPPNPVPPSVLRRAFVNNPDVNDPWDPRWAMQAVLLVTKVFLAVGNDTCHAVRERHVPCG